MPFKEILEDMLSQLPGAEGAIIADWEGEAVDQVARIDDFEMKILGAHKGIILTRLRDALQRVDGGEIEEVLIHFARTTVLITPLNEDYFLVLALASKVLTARAASVMRRCAAQLRREIC
ncbi:MAG: roadblock/LC7 domain-containing protein [Deltaproteobacteria bacterium]|nr:roadblock/LC7 domain-containing protein [Deltaproteobacteria bacterium]NCP01949.1 roadblock/LC7 domain-containing protein [Deltaproteobacteria bacterium]